jgi:anti-sigma factor NepR-like protein
MDRRMRGGTATQYEGGTLEVVKEHRKQEKSAGARERQRVIGRELRRMYDEVVQEPIPDDFIGILKQIDEHKDDKA